MYFLELFLDRTKLSRIQTRLSAAFEPKPNDSHSCSSVLKRQKRTCAMRMRTRSGSNPLFYCPILAILPTFQLHFLFSFKLIISYLISLPLSSSPFNSIPSSRRIAGRMGDSDGCIRLIHASAIHINHKSLLLLSSSAHTRVLAPTLCAADHFDTQQMRVLFICCQMWRSWLIFHTWNLKFSIKMKNARSYEHTTHT